VSQEPSLAVEAQRRAASELVLQCVAVCCSLLQRFAACCSDVEKETPSSLQIKSTCFIFPLQNSFCSVLQYVQRFAARCSDGGERISFFLADKL